jgi:hypothetical protein
MGKQINYNTVDFIKEYGKSWKNYVNKPFLIILSSTLSLTFISIIIIANKDYSVLNKNLSELITREYINTFFGDIKLEPSDVSIETEPYSSRMNIAPIENISDIEQSYTGSINSQYDLEIFRNSGLNIEEINLPEVLVAVKDKSISEVYVRPIRPERKYSIDLEETKSFDPWKDPIQRQGEIQIDPVDEIIRGSQIVRGWRNPDEITFAIQKKEPMIEYCFKREAKFFNDLRGYVIVRFIIMHTGIVNPESVQIIRSTLLNKKIELCIKKRLQLWRGFEELDASMGNVAVVQKFIFD